jgi:hypothetical protein
VALLKGSLGAGRDDVSIDNLNLAGVDQGLPDAAPCPGVTRQIVGPFALVIWQDAVPGYVQIKQIAVGAALIQ